MREYIKTSVLRVRVPSETAERIAARADEIGESTGGYLRKFLTRQFSMPNGVEKINTVAGNLDIELED